MVFEQSFWICFSIHLYLFWDIILWYFICVFWSGRWNLLKLDKVNIMNVMRMTLTTIVSGGSLFTQYTIHGAQNYQTIPYTVDLKYLIYGRAHPLSTICTIASICSHSLLLETGVDCIICPEQVYESSAWHVIQCFAFNNIWVFFSHIVNPVHSALHTFLS